MINIFKTKKSAGIPVTPAVHKKLQRANQARSAGQWSVAANLFGAALADDPKLYHIWMQLGHAEKECLRYDQAEIAYREAAQLQPYNSEPLLHLGHLYKVASKPVLAIKSYLEASRVEPSNGDAVIEFTRMIGQLTTLKHDEIAELTDMNLEDESQGEPELEQSVGKVLRSLNALAGQLSGVSKEKIDVLNSAATALKEIQGQANSSGSEHEDGRIILVFDASDLIGYFNNARLPTGIQRVQIEAINGAMAAGDKVVKICCFTDGRDDWLEVPAAQFRNLSQLAVKSGDREDSEWSTAINKLNLSLALSKPFEFPDNSFLINLGTSWWLNNYFLYVRYAKERHKIKYIPFVHDFIPIIMPEHCVKALTQDFISWAVGVFDHADFYLVNSEATKKDLLRVAKIIGHDVAPDDVVVVPLDADFRKPATRELKREYLAKWRLDEKPYVLLVATVESRKGHVVAMDAWLELIRRYGPRNVPRLVCVGKNGWLNDAVYDRLKHNDDLSSLVTILSNLSDDELALLYRHSQFTIYPSFYEGWGLPITESLCYGKPVIAAENSSLPEAGADLAVLVKSGSPFDLADAIDKMSNDVAYRASVEAKISATFKPRSWRDIARQIDQDVGLLAERRSGVVDYHAPLARLGHYHPVTSNVETRIWPGIGTGEIFRTGLGWWRPDVWGCWTRSQGGGLAIGLPKDCGMVRVYLLLKNFPNHDCPWRLRIKGLPTLSGTLLASEERWVSFDYPTSVGEHILRLHLRGEWSEVVKIHGRDHLVSVGLRGFFICAADDAVSRSAFLEAASLGNITELSAYRENIELQLEDEWEDE